MIIIRDQVRDENASLRQRDQFIYLSDLMRLCCQTNHIFQVKNLDKNKILRMDIPIMGFHFTQGRSTFSSIEDSDEEPDRRRVNYQ